MDEDQHRPVHAKELGCCSDWEMVPESLPTDEVGTFMTTDPSRCSGRASPNRANDADAHIHRVIVVDEQRHPVGVVTSTDVLAGRGPPVDTHF